MRLLNKDHHFEWLSEMEREVTMFLFATPGSLTTSVTDYCVHAFKSRIEMHGYVTAIRLKVYLESTSNELSWISYISYIISYIRVS